MALRLRGSRRTPTPGGGDHPSSAPPRLVARTFGIAARARGGGGARRQQPASAALAPPPKRTSAMAGRGSRALVVGFDRSPPSRATRASS